MFLISYLIVWEDNPVFRGRQPNNCLGTPSTQTTIRKNMNKHSKPRSGMAKMKLTPTLALRRVKVKVSADVVSLSLSMLSELSVVESSHSLLNVAGSEYSRCIIHSELVCCNSSWQKTRIITSIFPQQETRYSSRSYNVF